MYTHEQVISFANIMANSRRAVFFGGAGVSTESGIPDFRSQDGLYAEKYAYPPEYMLSATFFKKHTAEFFDFYRQKMVYSAAKPNAAHYALAKWEKEGRLSAVITQNIDGLHQAAGSKTVLELHGSIWRNRCFVCGKGYTLTAVTECGGVPRCACGGIIKPSVVLYEEPLESDVVQRSVQFIRAADTLIIGGTSLNVYPAAGLIDYFSGKNLIVINKGAPSRMAEGALYIDGGIAAFLAEVSAQS